MNIIRLVPVILSMLLLAAHFYRAGYIVLVILVLASSLMLLIRKPWITRVTQAILVLGGIEWIRTLIALASMRQSIGAPWGRLVMILGAVALFTIASALVFRMRALKERYGVDKGQF